MCLGFGDVTAPAGSISEMELHLLFGAWPLGVASDFCITQYNTVASTELDTGSSAAADGPRDALCQSKSCQLQQLWQLVVQQINNKSSISVDWRVVNYVRPATTRRPS